MGIDNYSYIIVADTYTVGNSSRIFCGSDNIRYIVYFSVCIFQRCFIVARRCRNDTLKLFCSRGICEYGYANRRWMYILRLGIVYSLGDCGCMNKTVSVDNQKNRCFRLKTF